MGAISEIISDQVISDGISEAWTAPAPQTDNSAENNAGGFQPGSSEDEEGIWLRRKYGGKQLKAPIELPKRKLFFAVEGGVIKVSMGDMDLLCHRVLRCEPLFEISVTSGEAKLWLKSFRLVDDSEEEKKEEKTSDRDTERMAARTMMRR